MIMAKPKVSAVWIKKARQISEILELQSKNLLTDKFGIKDACV